jgi:hypothetical protein
MATPAATPEIDEAEAFLAGLKAAEATGAAERSESSDEECPEAEIVPQTPPEAAKATPSQLKLTPAQAKRLAALRAAREAERQIARLSQQSATVQTAKKATAIDVFGPDIVLAEKDALEQCRAENKVKGYRKQGEYGAKKFIKP